MDELRLKYREVMEEWLHAYYPMNCEILIVGDRLVVINLTIYTEIRWYHILPPEINT